MRSRILSRLTIFAAFLVAATCASAQAYGPPITLEQARKAMDICPVGSIICKGVGFEVPIGKRKYDSMPIGSEIEA